MHGRRCIRRATAGQRRQIRHHSLPGLHGLRACQCQTVRPTLIACSCNALGLTTRDSIADQFAANGYLCVVPDIWEGDNVPLNWEPTSDFNLRSWMGKHGPEKVEAIGEAAIKALREEYGVTKLGGVEYCLGAKYVCRFMAGGRGVDAGFIAHPSATSGEEVKGVGGPLSIAAAGGFSRVLEVGDACWFLPSKKRTTCSRRPSAMRRRRSCGRWTSRIRSACTAMWTTGLR